MVLLFEQAMFSVKCPRRRGSVQSIAQSWWPTAEEIGDFNIARAETRWITSHIAQKHTELGLVGEFIRCCSYNRLSNRQRSWYQCFPNRVQIQPWSKDIQSDLPIVEGIASLSGRNVPLIRLGIASPSPLQIKPPGCTLVIFLFSSSFQVLYRWVIALKVGYEDRTGWFSNISSQMMKA